MEISATGEVGIGTSALSSFNSNRNNLVISDSSSAGLTLNSTATDGSSIISMTDGTGTLAGEIHYVHDGNYMQFKTSNSEAMRIDSSGRVGINAGGNGTIDAISYTGGQASLQFGCSYLSHLDVDGSGALYLANNVYYDGSNNKAKAYGYTSDYYQSGAAHIWRASGITSAGATASLDERMRIDSSGNLCVNDNTTRLPNGHTVSIAGDNSTHGLSVVRYNNSYGCYGINIGRSKNNTVGSNTALANNDTIGYVTWYGNDGTDTNSISAQIEARIDGTVAGNNVPGELVFRTSADGHGGGAGGESMIIDSSQNVGIGTAPATRLDVSNGTERHQVSFASGEVYLMARNASAYITQEYIANVHVFTGYGDSSSNEAMRIESDGDFVIGETSSTNVINGTGAYVATNGQLYASTSSTSGHFLNVQNDSQAVLNFRHAGSTEGDVSISGSTVTYNGFSGTHESSGIASNVEIGTVCSTIDELDVYPDTQPTAKGGTQEHPKKGQTRADHAKIKVSDTEGDKRVYGVLQRYDNNGKPLVASVGIGSVRVTGACEGGDLLESNGDGTAKVQSDDIIRSKTIGKVTIGNSNTGVKLVSCVLYCG